ncbi:MAG: hypothetical protein GY926_08875 [bacterium]|nr:hypothetical protein [bacterium]
MDPGDDNGARLEHLKMIQAVISRMAQNSFLIKGWTVTLIAALFALAAADSNPAFVIIALVPAIGFWGLDTFYLRQERLFRGLYDQVRQGVGAADFSMVTNPASTPESSYGSVGFSATLLAFYGFALVTVGLGFVAALIA